VRGLSLCKMYNAYLAGHNLAALQMTGGAIHGRQPSPGRVMETTQLSIMIGAAN